MNVSAGALSQLLLPNVESLPADVSLDQEWSVEFVWTRAAEFEESYLIRCMSHFAIAGGEAVFSDVAVIGGSLVPFKLPSPRAGSMTIQTPGEAVDITTQWSQVLAPHRGDVTVTVDQYPSGTRTLNNNVMPPLTGSPSGFQYVTIHNTLSIAIYEDVSNSTVTVDVQGLEGEDGSRMDLPLIWSFGISPQQ